MKTLSWTNIDKSTWGPGPWQSEPDKLQWKDPATNLPCLAVRGPLGAWCGYVGVSPEHPWHGIRYCGCLLKPPCGKEYCSHDTPERSIDVHGGLTFSNHCQEQKEEGKGICHIIESTEGDFEPAWWFGFDCAHAGDLWPGGIYELKHSLPRYGEYRDLPYVKEQVAQLAAQLAEVK